MMLYVYMMDVLLLNVCLHNACIQNANIYIWSWPLVLKHTCIHIPTYDACIMILDACMVHKSIMVLESMDGQTDGRFLLPMLKKADFLINAEENRSCSTTQVMRLPWQVGVDTRPQTISLRVRSNVIEENRKLDFWEIQMSEGEKSGMEELLT